MAGPLTSSSSPDDRVSIVCLYCHKAQDVGRRAMTVTCKFCNKSLRIEDVSIKQYEARRTIDTCGVVIVEKKGNVVADKIHCGAMVVRGKVKAAVNCRGTVLVGAEAEIRGDVQATALAVGAGAILNGHYKIGQEEPPGP